MEVVVGEEAWVVAAAILSGPRGLGVGREWAWAGAEVAVVAWDEEWAWDHLLVRWG